MRRFFEALGSGCVVYLIVAACSGDSKSPGSGTGGAGGSVASDSSLDALLDALSDVADAVGDPVPDAQAAIYQSGSRLRARYYAGEDGSKQFTGWWDSQRNESCSFAKAEDGQLRCLPPSYPTTYFIDSACTTRVIFVDAAICTPKYAANAKTLGAGCAKDTGNEVFAVGAELPLPSALYTETSTGCATMPIGSGYKVHALTQVPASAFVAATEQTE